MGISKLVVSILGCNTFIFGLIVGFMYDSVLMTSEWLINDDVIQRLRHKRDSSCESEAMPNHGQEKTLSHWWITIDDVIMSHDNDVIGHVTLWWRHWREKGENGKVDWRTDAEADVRVRAVRGWSYYGHRPHPHLARADSEAEWSGHDGDGDFTRSSAAFPVFCRHDSGKVITGHTIETSS